MKDWICFDDVVAGISSLILNNLVPGTIIELGAGKASSLLSIIEKMFDLVGGSSKPVPGATVDGVGEEGLQAATINRTKEQISWTPKVSLDEGLHKYHRWLVGQS